MPYPLEVRLAAIGEYRLGVSRKEIAFKYSISDPTVSSEPKHGKYVLKTNMDM